MAPHESLMEQAITEQKLGEARHPYIELVGLLSNKVSSILEGLPNTNTFLINKMLIEEGLVNQILDDPKHLNLTDRKDSMSQAMAVADWESSLMKLISYQVNLHANQPFLDENETTMFIHARDTLGSSGFNRNGQRLSKLLKAAQLLLPFLTAKQDELKQAVTIENNIAAWNLDFRFFNSPSFQQFIESAK